MKPTYLLAILIVSAPALGQTTTFTGASDYRTWSDPLNWDNGVPADGYDVALPAIDEPYSIMDLPDLELRSLTAVFGRNGGDLALEFPLAITGDLDIRPSPAAEASDCFTVAGSLLEVGGDVLLVNCRWQEGSARIAGDFYFQGDNISCSFNLNAGPNRRAIWEVGGDFWIPVCAWFDITRADILVGGDFVLNGNPQRSPLCDEMTLTVAGAGPSLVSLPVPQDPYHGIIPWLTVNMNSHTDVVVLDAAELGPIHVGNLAVHTGTVELRADARIDEITVDHGATLTAPASIGLQGRFLMANGQVNLEAPGLSLAMIGIATGPGGVFRLAGNAGQPAWLTPPALYATETYISGNTENVTLREVAIGHCRAWPEIRATGCRDLGSNDGISFDTASVVGGTSAPQPLMLGQNRPNPFNAATQIRYELPAPGPASLRIFDLGGRLVRTLFDQETAAAQGVAIWDGRDDRGAAVAAGAYLYQVNTPKSATAKKMILLK